MLCTQSYTTHCSHRVTAVSVPNLVIPSFQNHVLSEGQVSQSFIIITIRHYVNIVLPLAFALLFLESSGLSGRGHFGQTALPIKGTRKGRQSCF